mgnify:CR=1 FL=1
MTIKYLAAVLAATSQATQLSNGFTAEFNQDTC